MKGRQRDQVILLSPPSCMPHDIAGMSGGQLTEQYKAPLLRGSGGSSHSLHSWCGPLTITRYALKNCGGADLNG